MDSSLTILITGFVALVSSVLTYNLAVRKLRAEQSVRDKEQEAKDGIQTNTFVTNFLLDQEKFRNEIRQELIVTRKELNDSRDKNFVLEQRINILDSQLQEINKSNIDLRKENETWESKHKTLEIELARYVQLNEINIAKIKVLEDRVKELEAGNPKKHE